MEVQAFCWVNQITITPKKIHLGWLCLAECNILLSDCLPNVTIMLPCSPMSVPLGHQAIHPDTFGSPMHTAHQWTLLIIPFFALLWGLPMQLIALLEDRDLTNQCSVRCIDCLCTDQSWDKLKCNNFKHDDLGSQTKMMELIRHIGHYIILWRDIKVDQGRCKQLSYKLFGIFHYLFPRQSSMRLNKKTKRLPKV